MPIILLGLILIAAIIAYWHFSGANENDYDVSEQDVKRGANAFEERARKMARDVSDDIAKAVRKRAGIFDVDYDVVDNETDKTCMRDEEDNTIPFPSDAEREKRNRDIK